MAREAAGRSRLRILHVYQSPSFSGAESYALEVARHHVDTGGETWFLALPSSPLEQRVREIQKIRITTDASALDWNQFDAVILHSTQELKSHWVRLAKAKVRARFSPNSDLRSPRVIVYSHIWISHSKRDPLHALLYSLVDQFWCSSNSSREALIRFLPMPAEKILVVRYGRDTAALLRDFHSREMSRRELDIPETATVFGTISRVDKGKGSTELFDAAISLLRKDSELHFLMIGPPTASDPKAVELDRELELRMEELKNADPSLRSRVHKRGRLDQGSRFLKVFDLFVLATYKENFALTLLEAQLAGVPCLATNSGGSPDVVRRGETGWLFEPESATAIEKTVSDALNSRSLWPKYSERGHKQVVELYDFQMVMKDVDRLLTYNLGSEKTKSGDAQTPSRT